jgi:hypothetical protein
VEDPDKLLDPDRTPADWLEWLGQFVGAGVSGKRGRVAERTNLVPHPSFEDGTVGTPPLSFVTSTAGDPAASTTPTKDWARYGVWSVRYQVTRSDGAATVVRTPIGTSGVPVTPNGWYGGRVSGRLRAGVPGATVVARIYWYKSDGTASTVTSSAAGSAVSVPISQVVDLNVKAQAPSDAAFASIGFYTSVGVAYSLDVDVDAFAVYRLSGAADAVPGYGDGTFADWIWNGAAYNSTSSLMRVETDAELRARISPLIKDPPKRRRGTVPAILEVVRNLLTPGASIFYNERVGGNWKTGTIAILTGSRKTGVTLQNIQDAVNAVKPAGSLITVSEITGGNWQSVRDTHTDWLDVRATFVDWAEVRSNPTKQ